MERTDILGFQVRWHFKTVSAFVFLLVLPNLLGMIHVSTPWDFQLHLFPFAVFCAAFLFGPKGGALSGAMGSLYIAAVSGNPYILVGNAILGFFAGALFRYGFHPVASALMAYAIQLPWLIVTDYYFMHLPAAFILNLTIALALSNALWSTAANLCLRPLRKGLEC